MKIKLLVFTFFLLISGFLFVDKVSARSFYCETNTLHNGAGCYDYNNNSWCGGGGTTTSGNNCTANEPLNTSCSAKPHSSWDCSTCACTCSSGYTDCSGTCTLTSSGPSGCNNFNTCTGVCNSCGSGILCANSCMANNCNAWETPSCNGSSITCTAPTASIKLASDSVISDRLKNSVTTNPLMTILSTGYTGIGTSTPLTLLSLTGGNMFINDAIITAGTPKSVITKEYLDSVLVGSGFWSSVSDGITTGKGSVYITNGALVVSGNVTIGDTNNKYQLTVDKLKVGTIDPLYDIFGVKYSSFAASIVGGVKEEVTGKISLNTKTGNEYQAVIDFDKQLIGSDLWVWRKVIDFNKDNVEAFITPYGKFASTYYYIKGNNLIFRSNTPVEISYRLIAKRFDWLNWPTLANNQSEKASLFIK